MNNVNENIYKKFFLKYLKYWKIFLVSVLFFVSLMVAYIKIATPVYLVKANVLIKDENAKNSFGSSMMKDLSVGFGFPGSMDVEDELYVVSSHTVLRKAVEDLGMCIGYEQVKYGFKKINQYKNSDFTLAPQAFQLDTLTATLQFKLSVEAGSTGNVTVLENGKKLSKVAFESLPTSIQTSYGNFLLSPTKKYHAEKSYRYFITVESPNMVAESLGKEVSIDLASKKANVISLDFKTKNVELGKDLLNTIIQQYNKDAIEDKNILASNTISFIDNRLSLISIELSEVEHEIEKYKTDKNIFDLNAEAKSLITQNSELKKSILEIQTKMEVIDILNSFVSDKKNQFALVPSSLALTEDGVVAVMQEYNKLLLERLKLSQNTSLSNPMLILLDKQIEASRKNVLLSIDNTKKSLRVTLNELQKQEATMNNRYMSGPKIEREFWDIKRSQVLKEQLFLFLVEKREENALKLAVTTPKAKIIDHAYIQHKPLSPNKMMLLFMGLLLGMGFPFAFVYLKTLFYTTFDSKSELEDITMLPVLGEICKNKDVEKKIVVQEGSTSSIAELFRLIRTNLQFVLNRKTDKVILITSTRSGEGKSFLSINLALTLSLLNKKVLLIGLDIRNPRVQHYLSLDKTQKGVTNYLASEDICVDEIISPFKQNVDIITSGPIPPNPSELLSTERVDQLFDYLRERYDYIVVDSAPVGMVSDTFSLTRVSDATLYVCRANFTTRENIHFAENLVKNKQLKNVSLVINETKTKAAYGYGYGHHHRTTQK